MGQITIVGLGPGAFGLMTLEAWEAITAAPELILRTGVHPTVAELVKRGVKFTSYDGLYESGDSFAQVYAAIAGDVVKRAAAGARLVYAVPGSPLVAERTVGLIRRQAREANIPVKIIPGMSFLEVLYARLDVDPIDGLTVLDAADLGSWSGDTSAALVVTQVYDRRIASDVKLALMDNYPDEHTVALARNLGLPGEVIVELPLYELDRQDGIDHLTSVYVAPYQRQSRFDMSPLTDVMATLRSPGGCIWDIEQTHRSLRRNIIEEVYEVVEAIDLAKPELLCEELGDLLLQIVFHARMAEESGQFSMQDVIDGITAKLIRRHPHVFGDVSVRDAGEVVMNWDAIKQVEKAAERSSVLDGIPKDLPSPMRAYKLQHKAAKVGFDWDNIDPVWDKIKEEIAELREALADGDEQHIEEEFGDCLFAFINLGRFIGVDAEVALNRVNNKFQRRFSYVERQVVNSAKDWREYTLDELDSFWNDAKALKL